MNCSVNCSRRAPCDAARAAPPTSRRRRRYSGQRPFRCRPRRLPAPISQRPAPPKPPKAKSTPKMAPMFSTCSADTDAVAVGNMMEKKNPVSGMKMVRPGGPKIPTLRQTIAAAVAVNMTVR